MNTFEKIYEVVKSIPEGKVATYGQVALLAGNPRWARVVGYALHVNPYPGIIPCHRVVNREGGVAPGFAFGGEGKPELLRSGKGLRLPHDSLLYAQADDHHLLWRPAGGSAGADRALRVGKGPRESSPGSMAG